MNKRIRFSSLVLTLFLFSSLWGCGEDEPPKPVPQTQQPFEPAQDHETLSSVGADVCAGSHERVYQAWRSSRHAASMQPANATTVLGMKGILQHLR